MRLCVGLLVLAVVCSSGVSATPGLTATFWNNNAWAGSPIGNITVDSTAWTNVSALGLKAGDDFSVLVQGYLTQTAAGNQSFMCTVADPHQPSSQSSFLLWVDDHLLCPHDDYILEKMPFQAGQVRTFRAEFNYFANGSTTLPSFNVLMGTNVTGKPVSFAPITKSDLSLGVTAPEATRQALRARHRNSGWSTWENTNMAAHVLLPESYAVSLQLYDPVSKTVMQAPTVRRNGSDPQVRPGPHSWGSSQYTWMSVFWQGQNMTFESTLSEDGKDLMLLVTPVNVSSNASEVYNVEFIPSFSFGNRWGSLSASTTGNGQLTYSQQNRPTVSLFGSQAAMAPSNGTGVSFSLAHGPVAFCSGSSRSVATVQAAVAAAKAAEIKSYSKYGDLASSFYPIKTIMAWNTMFNTHEGVTTPVSKNWEFGPRLPTTRYVLFDWDNYFSSFMTSVDDEAARDIAYNNAIQITMASVEVPDGTSFIPNYSAATFKSRDRTEPQIGSAVILEMYNRWKDKWVVELLFDNLYNWNTWTWVHRREDPLGLVCLGSDPNPPAKDNGATNTMQGARYESGLDNSPMYDGEFFNNATHHMQLYDVGMSSMFARDCEALVELAGAIGRQDVVPTLKTRLATMQNLIQQHLWNDTMGIYVNRRSDTGEAYPRLSPTLFYPMLSGTPTVAQAERMVSEHLTNVSEFCVHPWKDETGGTCMFGLPSIARNDPAFGGTYWRGRIWGPMVQLVYWGLHRYAGSPVIDAARKALVEQSHHMLMKEWLELGHLHENYNATSGIGCDVSDSDPWYTWSALTVFIGLQEAGVYNDTTSVIANNM